MMLMYTFSLFSINKINYLLHWLILLFNFTYFSNDRRKAFFITNIFFHIYHSQFRWVRITYINADYESRKYMSRNNLVKIASLLLASICLVWSSSNGHHIISSGHIFNIHDHLANSVYLLGFPLSEISMNIVIEPIKKCTP